MHDKEVGELWADKHQEWFNRVTIENLIRKLVKERAKNKRLQIRAEDCGRPAHNFPEDQPMIDRSVNEEILALRDYGIDEEEWK